MVEVAYMTNRSKSKSTLFLIELLIVILIFAIYAAVCISIFVSSYFMAENSRDNNNALLIAESGVECYKAVNGDFNKAALILNGFASGDGILTVFYDINQQVCNEDDAEYILRITSLNPSDAFTSLTYGDLLVEKVTGEELISFQIVARSEIE